MKASIIVEGVTVSAQTVPAVSERLAARYGITVADLRELSWLAVVALETAYRKSLAGASDCRKAIL
jgi:hypothetical protein